MHGLHTDCHTAKPTRASHVQRPQDEDGAEDQHQIRQPRQGALRQASASMHLMSILSYPFTLSLIAYQPINSSSNPRTTCLNNTRELAVIALQCKFGEGSDC